MTETQNQESYQSKGFCGKESPSGESSCYLDLVHEGPHYAPCYIHGDVACGHEEEWESLDEKAD